MEHKYVEPGGESYLPFARSRLASMRRAGVKFGTQRFPVDNVVITVRTVGGIEYIDIRSCQLKMESGGIEVGTTPTNVPLIATSADLWVSAPCAALVAHDKRADKNLKSPRKSAVYKLPEFDPRGEGEELAAHMALVSKKTKLIQFQASQFSGKMRLFIQAMLGSNPERLSSTAGGQWQIDGCLPFGPSTAIFCDAWGIYWMLYIDGTTVYRTRMVFNTCAESIRVRLGGLPVPPDERAVQEAYMFSGFAVYEPNTNLDSSNPVHLGERADIAAIPGSTLAHDWHFSRESGLGTKVVHVPVTDAGPWTGAYMSAIASLVITSGKRSEPPELTASVGLSANYTRSSEGPHLFGVTGGRNFYIPGARVAPRQSDAPMYSFFDADDGLIVARAKIRIEPDSTYATRGLYICSGGSDGYAGTAWTNQISFVASCEKASAAAATGTSVEKTGELKIDGGERTTVYKAVESNTYITPLAGITFGCSAPPPESPFIPGFWGTTAYVHYGMLRGHYEVATATNRAAVCFLPSPTDVDCIYIGSRQVAAKSTLVKDTYVEVVRTADYIGYGDPEQAIRPRPDYSLVAGCSDQADRQASNGLVTTERVDTNAPILDAVYCVTQHDTVEISKSDGYTVDGWTYVFDPDDGFDRVYSVFESYSGSAQFVVNAWPYVIGLSENARENANFFTGYA